MAPAPLAITGIGLLTPLGGSARATWAALMAGTSAVRPSCARVHGRGDLWVAPLPLGVAPSNPDPMRHSCATHYALLAARDALADSGGAPPGRGGVAMGVATGDGPAPVAAPAAGPRSPHWIARVLPSAPAGCLSQTYGLRGPNLTNSAACASGAGAVVDAALAIAAGEADWMLAGGAEAALIPAPLEGFASARAIARLRPPPPVAVAGALLPLPRFAGPFDAARAGFAAGEGAAVLVLESAAAAHARGARVYALLTGFGRAADAYHPSAPAPDARGALDAMRAAAAGDRIDYVNAHAAGTPRGDAAEALAIAAAAPHAATSSIKGATGHLLGAAGALELAVTALALYHQCAPGTAALHRLDPALTAGLNVLTAPTSCRLQVALSNAFAFGGACVAIKLAACTDLGPR